MKVELSSQRIEMFKLFFHHKHGRHDVTYKPANHFLSLWSYSIVANCQNEYTFSFIFYAPLVYLNWG